MRPYRFFFFGGRYLPYFVAEAVEMSGIVATLFAGITTRHYAHRNLSPASQETAIFIFKLTVRYSGCRLSIGGASG